MIMDEIVRRLGELEKQVERLQALEFTRMIRLAAPLTSTSWDGDSFSTIGKTLIDLSAVFGVPAKVREILASIDIRDSGSAGTDCCLLLSPNSTDYSGEYVRCSGLADDSWASETFWVSCNSDGDVYYQILASGAGLLEVYIRIWGYAY